MGDLDRDLKDTIEELLDEIDRLMDEVDGLRKILFDPDRVIWSEGGQCDWCHEQVYADDVGEPWKCDHKDTCEVGKLLENENA